MRAAPAYQPDPRMWTMHQVCQRLHRSPEWFRLNRDKLEKAGFPRRDELFGAWDSLAIEHFLNWRAGLSKVSPVEDYRGVADGL